MLQQLLYSEEVRRFDEIEIPKAKLNDTELKLAKQLIDSITTDSGFEASKYQDDVKERIEQMIAQKVSGREITAPEAPAAPEGARVIDLMQALRASLKAGPKVAAKAAGRSAAGAEAGARACANLVRKRPTFTNSFESRFQALFVPLWINHAHVVLAKLRCAVQVARYRSAGSTRGLPQAG